MDYKECYEKSYEKYFKYHSEQFKQELLQGKEKGQTFTYTSNDLLKGLNLEQNQKLDPITELYTYFETRAEIFNLDSVNKIVSQKILPLVNQNDIEKLVEQFGEINALKKVKNLFNNQKRIYELMFDLNDFKKFEIRQFCSVLESDPLFRKLQLKLYPKPKIRKTKKVISGDDNDTFLTVKEVSELTNYAVTTIYDKVHKKQIPSNKPGGKLQFNKKDILDWMNSGRRMTKQEIEAKANEYIQQNS